MAPAKKMTRPIAAAMPMNWMPRSPSTSPPNDETIANALSPTQAVEEEALLAESVSRALLVVLATLTSTERVALVLHDMFAVPFDEIAHIMDRSACWRLM